MGLSQKKLKTDFRHHNLLGIADLSAGEIGLLLDRSDHYAAKNRTLRRRSKRLRGRTVNQPVLRNLDAHAHLVRARRAAAPAPDVINMTVEHSSIKKGETLLDTALTLNAMHPDVLVCRHPESGAVKLLSQKVNCVVVNAGDGSHEHPTQALLDALTIRRRTGRLQGLTVAICGDVMHSRVARSNIYLLQTMGARVRVIGPPTLVAGHHGAFRRRGLPQHGTRPARRRHRDDAAPPARADAGQLRALDAGVFPLLRTGLPEACRRQAGCADHAPRPDEPRRRDRQRGRRRFRPQRHPGTGRDGRCRAHGPAWKC